MCANDKCRHWSGGCQLFPGEAWRRCRRAIVAKPSASAGRGGVPPPPAPAVKARRPRRAE